MTDDTSESVSPARLANYAIVRTLARNRSFLAQAGDRRVVLKLLDAECLAGPEHRQLHPGIRDRLARVRELAELRVANLIGVERDGDAVFLVWEYVEGAPLDAAATTSAGLRLFARELVDIVRSLHARGLVHGAIHSNNVLVDPVGRVRLIDVSPLLFQDPRQDERAVLELLQKLSIALPSTEEVHDLDESIDRAARHRSPLDCLANDLSGAGGAATVQAETSDLPGRSRRRHSLAGALMVGLLGIAIAAAVIFSQRVNGADSATPGAATESPAP